MIGDKILINTGPSKRGWHRLQDFLLCPQWYAYRQILKLELGDRRPLVLGSLCHVGMAHYYARMKLRALGEDPEKYFDPITAIALVADTPDMAPLGPKLKSEAQLVTEAYIYERSGEQLDVFAVEEPVEVTLDREGRFLFTQRWDLVVREAGYYWLWDHKTAARPNTSTLLRYAMSGQFIGASLIGQKLFGKQFGGIRINFLGTSAPYKFSRANLERATWAESQFPYRMAEVEERILALQGRDPWDYPKSLHEHACVTAYGPCAAYELCRYGKGILAEVTNAY